MATDAKEPISSMGNDTPLAVLSDKPQRFFAYFKQLFAQVTNPPIDSIREELVMSLRLYIGTEEGNMLEPSDKLCKMVKLQSPIIDDTQLDILKNIRYKGFKSVTLPMTFRAGKGSLGSAVDALCRSAEAAVDGGCNYIILSDRGVDAEDVARAARPLAPGVPLSDISAQKDADRHSGGVGRPKGADPLCTTVCIRSIGGKPLHGICSYKQTH